MNKRIELEFDQSGYERLKNYATETGQIVLDAKRILENLEVKSNAKELLDGEFVSMFHKHHKNAHANEKDGFAKRLSYEKYIEMLEFDITPLIELENNYKNRISKSDEYYRRNHRFYQYCEVRAPRNPFLKDFLDEAPGKTSLSIKDLFKISRNKVIVEIDTELFTLYTTNSKQIEVMNDITNFVKISKRLGLKREEDKPLINSYLFDDSFNIQQFRRGKIGLSLDLNTINFNNYKILTIK